MFAKASQFRTLLEILQNFKRFYSWQAISREILCNRTHLILHNIRFDFFFRNLDGLFVIYSSTALDRQESNNFLKAILFSR
jgi:hypothetical protein